MDNYQVNNEHYNDLSTEVIELFRKQWIKFNDEQKNDILQGKAQLRVNCSYPKAIKKKEISSRKPIDKIHLNENLDYTQLSQRLDELNSKEEGLEFLKSYFSTKKSLESFAKFLKISTQKQNLQELRESIVSATIGYRLTIQSIEKRRRPKLEDECLNENKKIPENNIEENDDLSITQEGDKQEIEPSTTQIQTQNQANDNLPITQEGDKQEIEPSATQIEPHIEKIEENSNE